MTAAMGFALGAENEHRRYGRRTTPCDCDASRRGAHRCMAKGNGEVTDWRRVVACQRSEFGHTFVSGLSDGRAGDDSRGGNGVSFMNHACTRNCEAIEEDVRIFIHAVGTIEPDNGLLINSRLEVDGEITDDVLGQYASHSNAIGCRRAMLGGSAKGRQPCAHKPLTAGPWSLFAFAP